MGLNDLELFGFGLRFCVFRQRAVIKWQPISAGLVSECFMVGDDTSQLSRHLSRTETEYGIVKAMIGF